MNPLDLGVIAVVILSAIFAFARGFVREALSIVAWVGAAYIALRGFGPVYDIVEPVVHNPLLSQLIAGLGTFLVALIVLTIVTSILARYVRASALSPIDRTLGFIFGLARGLFVCCLAFLLLDASVQPNDRPPWIRDAKSAPYLHQGAELLRGFLPEQLKLRSANAAEDTLRNLDAETLARLARGALANPTPAPAEAPAPAASNKPEQQPQPNPATVPNYRTGDRRDLDRLIGTQR